MEKYKKYDNQIKAEILPLIMRMPMPILSSSAVIGLIVALACFTLLCEAVKAIS